MTMWISLIGAVVLLVLAAVARRHSAGLGTVLAVAGLLAASFALAARFRTPEKVAQARMDQAEEIGGVMLGRRLAADFPSGGTLLVLRRPPLNRAKDEQSAARLRGLQQGVGKVPFTYVEIGSDPIGLGSDRPGFQIFPETALAREAVARCAKDPKIVAIVSLMPWLPPPPEAGTKTAPWYAFDGGPVQQNVTYLSRGFAKVVYVNNPLTAPSSVHPSKMSDEQVFKYVFTELTPKSSR